MADSPFHFFGIRHHGPGCARSLRDALEQLQPDCILLEGPPEGEALLDFLQDQKLIPPVALLIFNPENSQDACFYPYAIFSPEWQALQYAKQQTIPVRFMDLSVGISFALETDAIEHDIVTEEAEEENPRYVADPLDWLGKAAGHADGESWWNQLIEERCDSLEVFAAIREAMFTVRQEVPERSYNIFKRHIEKLREASMRKIMREAQKDFSRIAVICGAWHLPALENMPSAKADNELLKSLNKVKTTATWVPWSYPHLTYESGYGAGVLSPQWYEHVWLHTDTHSRGIHWLTQAAHLFRAENFDCSSAQIIDAARLADALAAMRERPQPGLDELTEALISTVCMGDATRFNFIHKKLILGNRLGEIPESVPSIPLQRDIEQLQKSLRLKPEASQKVVDLDLRKENDLAKSHFLHRLRLLKIRWGDLQDTGSSAKGSFHEIWTLQWQPEFSLAIIEAGRWGNSVEKAATKFTINKAESCQRLDELTHLLDKLLLADIPDAMPTLAERLETLSAASGDLLQLLQSIPPLSQIARYSNVRQIDTSIVNKLLHHLVPRTAIALSSGCQSADEESARDLQQAIVKAHQSIQLLNTEELYSVWIHEIKKLRHFPRHAGLIAGTACRLVFDAQHNDAEEKELISQYMSQALSVGQEPVDAALWLEGFLQNSGMVLLHDDQLWQLINQWLLSLSSDYFVKTLPLIRRSFGQFSATEKRQLGSKAEQAQQQTIISTTLHLDVARGEKALALVQTILGI